MPIEGPISDLALTDLLQLLSLSRKTGRLVVQTGVQDVTLLLREGALVGATGGGPELRLGRLLVQSGRATETQIRRGLEAQRERPEQLIGEILVEQGVVREAEVQRQLRFQIEETLIDLMRVQEGHLRFQEAPPGPEPAIEVVLGTDSVLMNAARRLDELTEVLPGGGAGDPLPRLASSPAGEAAPLHLQLVEWEVLAAVDGERTLKSIARSLGRGELEVARALYQLAEVGVVEVGAGERLPAEVAGEPRQVLRELDEAIRQANRDRAERLFESLQQGLGGQAPNAEILLMRGRLQALQSDWSGSVQSLKEAITLDPLMAEGYFHLARTAIRTGDLAGAGEALKIYRRLHDHSPARRSAASRMAHSLEDLLNSTGEAEP